MTRLRPTWSSRKIFNFTYQSVDENLQGTPTALPLTEPATAQVSKTVASGHLPSTDIPLASKKYIGVLVAAGQNTDAAQQTVYWRMKKNGSNVNTGSLTVAAGYYWTVEAWFYDIVVNDTLELFLWASSTNVNWDYDGYHTQFTRINFYNKYIFGLKVEAITGQPNLTSGNPSSTGNYHFYIIHKDGNFSPGASNYYYRDGTAGALFGALYPDSTYGTYYVRFGDLQSGNDALTFTHGSYRPRYSQNPAPSKISLRYLAKWET